MSDLPLFLRCLKKAGSKAVTSKKEYCWFFSLISSVAIYLNQRVVTTKKTGPTMIVCKHY